MRTAPQAIEAAKSQKSNSPGMCQAWTHRLFEPDGSLAVGDRDGDRDADAVDGWKSEPVSLRFSDRRPMIGAPGAWRGGSGGFGHRAICIGYLGNDPLFRSTDGAGRGRIGNHTLAWFEKEWNLEWLGWSKTISGRKIEGLVLPPGAKPAAAKPAIQTRGVKVEHALADLRAAKSTPGSVRQTMIHQAIRNLNQVPFL